MRRFIIHLGKKARRCLQKNKPRFEAHSSRNSAEKNSLPCVQAGRSSLSLGRILRWRASPPSPHASSLLQGSLFCCKAEYRYDPNTAQLRKDRSSAENTTDGLTNLGVRTASVGFPSSLHPFATKNTFTSIPWTAANCFVFWLVICGCMYGSLPL